VTVLNVSGLTVKPDRYEDFVTTTRKAKAILEKHGARNVRLLVAMTAGQASGSFALSSEYDDFTDAGRALDKFFGKGWR